MLQFPVELLSCDSLRRRRRMQSHCSVFLNYFLLEQCCFTMLCQSLLYCKMSRPCTYVCPLPFGLPPHSGHHSAIRRVPCAAEYDLISCLFSTQYQYCVCVNYNLSVSPGFFNMHKLINVACPVSCSTLSVTNKLFLQSYKSCHKKKVNIVSEKKILLHQQQLFQQGQARVSSPTELHQPQAEEGRGK